MQQLYSEAAGKFLADRFVYGTCPKCGYDVSTCRTPLSYDRALPSLLPFRMLAATSATATAAS